ncbi:MAG: retroviral-like aspartic protease family protein [Candidatus Marinimicrobia bacterium]|nr:retroviral-like aspartic protease family protein [Candidatus Neomarinimicrobiota bacterium]MDD9887059.1 retroviral-like aspartic protease family protein [Candidatus Neomarinimicrobiota bacterium]MDD9931914.1 retroviral-like aspartic protease family protein [Candidatus Neomarinimicrobiota bacterium]
MKQLLSIILLTLVFSATRAQGTIEEGWALWSKAELEKAEKIAEAYLDADEGKHLKGNILQVNGKYLEAIELYNSISSEYNEYEKVQISKLNIYLFHLKELDKAKALIDGINNKDATIYAASINKPITLECSGTFTVPMLVTEPLNPFIPIVSGEINGKKQNIAFDTGANFLVMSKAAAESMGISYNSSLFFIGKQGYSTSKMWVGVVDNLVLGKDVKLKNVPVTIMEEMNTEIIIFGTNILKEFYTTIDYPNNQFVFTTKDKPELVRAHQKRYAGNEMNFIMWSDHYMMGKGSYNDKRINMFFDSGLVVVGQANGAIAQSWLCLSKESMENLGIEEKDNTSTRAVTATNDVLNFAGVDNENVILSLSGIDEFSFGGIMCDLLVSHGVLKHYAWTIDFENMKYIFK